MFLYLSNSITSLHSFYHSELLGLMAASTACRRHNDQNLKVESGNEDTIRLPMLLTTLVHCSELLMLKLEDTVDEARRAGEGMLLYIQVRRADVCLTEK